MLQAAALGAEEPEGSLPDREHLHRHCDAFGFAPLVARDGSTLRLNVADAAGSYGHWGSSPPEPIVLVPRSGAPAR